MCIMWPISNNGLISLCLKDNKLRKNKAMSIDKFYSMFFFKNKENAWIVGGRRKIKPGYLRWGQL